VKWISVNLMANCFLLTFRLVIMAPLAEFLLSSDPTQLKVKVLLTIKDSHKQTYECGNALILAE
jgi:hypothetical protein